jgi:drug/metabolite transporter (DMT)-like permease
MVYIFLSIICSTCLFLLFKFFDIQKINSFHAIVFNYFIASVFGFSRVDNIFENIPQQAWFIHAIIIGVLFISMFYVIAFASQKIGPSAASVANKMSVVIPVFFAIILFNDSASFFKLTGLFLALIGVYFATKRNSEQLEIKKWIALLLILFLFLGNGFLDTYLNYVQNTFLNEHDTLMFAPVIFSSAFIIGFAILLYQVGFLKSKISVKSIYYGVLLGIINYGSIYFLIKSLQLPNVESSVIFPLNNIGIVVATSIFSFFIFKEKMSIKNVLGIILSVFAIFLISFSS